MDFLQLLVIFVSFMLAGGINAIAGGGTVFSFTGLLWAGLPTVMANATNATALVPGSIGSLVAYRRDLRPVWRTFVVLLIPTIAGSLLGALVVVNTAESTFRQIVPFLVLFAVLVFAGRNFITRLGKQAQAAVTHGNRHHVSRVGYVVGIALQFLISFYGGFFGAGIGILMLTSFSVMGMRDVHRMNALKVALAAFINGTAAISFLIGGKVNIPIAILGAVGATVGGYALARLAKRVNQNTLRAGIVVAGLVVVGWMFYRLR